ncbi:MAG TPA: dTMP kinase [Coxiellaceae bacterium]|nr:MAG: dTMP kinase [Gammaproteobacteria bacterium RIFCSPHIGHO2_12_FULL_36_30]HLB57073.1 dTMP kinase [Coxiellaceae bacterium]
MSLITLEGCEGVGKSTALTFIQKYFSEKKIECVFTREPGGTKIGEAIREILLHNTSENIFPDTELLLMFAARAQHIAQIIKPALSAGKTVVSDRFTDASFAYQGGGRKIPAERIQILSDFVQGNLQPDLTLLLDAPVEIGLSRMQSRGKKDRIEQESIDFFNRVRNTYLNRAKQFPERFVIIDASGSLANTQKQIKAALDSKIK